MLKRFVTLSLSLALAASAVSAVTAPQAELEETSLTAAVATLPVDAPAPEETPAVTEVPVEEEIPEEVPVVEPTPSPLEGDCQVALCVDGVQVGFLCPVFDQVTYVPFALTVMALRPDATVVWEDGKFIAAGSDFTMTAQAGTCYLMINDRYLYLPDGYETDADGNVYLPVRTLCRALGVEVSWDGNVDLITGGTPLQYADRPYTDTDLDELSRVIMYEVGAESFESYLAIGSVIMNRVRNGYFPDTVSGVIYQPGQFTNAGAGKRWAMTDVAAKICLEGDVNTVPGALYFNMKGVNCWARRNRPLLYTIEGVDYYG